MVNIWEEPGSLFSIISKPALRFSLNLFSKDHKLNKLKPLSLSPSIACCIPRSLWWPSTGLASICLSFSLLGSSRLDEVLQTQSHKCWIVGNDHFTYLLPLLIQPSMALVFISTRMHCRLMFNVLPTRPPRSFSAELLSFPVGAWAVDWDYSISAAWLSWGFWQNIPDFTALIYRICYPMFHLNLPDISVDNGK